MADDVNAAADYYVKYFGFKVVQTVLDMKKPNSGKMAICHSCQRRGNTNDTIPRYSGTGYSGNESL